MDATDVNEAVISQFRSGGEVTGMHRERLVLLTTIGEKSGRRRIAPLMFQPVPDGGYLVIASASGAPADPQWFRNLVAEPRVHVEAPKEEFDADTEVLSGTEREDAWQRLVEDYPFFAENADRAGREIPLVVLRPTQD